MLHKIISIVQLVLSILLIGLILIQQKGGGLSSVFGGNGGNFTKRRGMEQTIHVFTIILVVLFIVSSTLIFIF